MPELAPVVRLASRAGWSTLDQAVLALTNLALSVAVARSVDAGAFGAFSLCFTVYTITLVCSRNLASEPVVIRFAARGRGEVRGAAARSAGTAAVIGLAVGTVSVAVGLALGGAVGACLLAMGLVLPGLLVQDTWRFAFFALGEPRSAAVLDLVWGGLQLGLVLLLVATDVSATGLFVLAWGGAGCAAAALGTRRTGVLPRVLAAPGWLRENWDLTRFMLFEALLLQGAVQGVLLGVGLLGDVEAVGALRAAQVVNGPVNLLSASAFAFAVPELVRRARQRDAHPVLVAAGVGGALAIAAAAWNGVLLLLPDAVGVQLLGDSWDGVRVVLPYVAVGLVGNILAVGPAVVVYSMGATRTSFRIHGVVAVLLAAGGVGGYAAGGAAGAAAGFAAGYCAVLPRWFWRVRALGRARRGLDGDGPAAPRVLLVTDSLARTGAAKVSLELAQRLAPDGARLAVLLHRTDVPLVEVPDGVRLLRLSNGPARLRAVLPRALVRLVVAARRSDVVVGCSEIGPGLPLGLVAARLARRPYVVAVHADLDAALHEWTAPRLQPVLRWAHRHVDGAVAVAPALVEPLLRNGLHPHRARVVVNGIDVEAVRAAGSGPGSLVVDGVPTVVATGRLAPQKAVELLVEAHARLVDDLPHRVLLLNDGPECEALRALARERGVQASVVFAGAVSPVLPSVADADVFCLPSRHEGLPLALLEAVALGTPCIAATSSEGVRAALDGGRVGDLVPVDDVDALTEALRRHLRDPGPLRAKARRGPAHARTFDVAAMADGWAAALRDVVAAPPAAAPAPAVAQHPETAQVPDVAQVPETAQAPK